MSIKKAFSLIEVLVFVTILALFLITAAAIITVSIRQNTLKINTLKATHYNQEALTWVRGQRETDWNSFVILADVAGKSYCLSNSVMSWSIAPCTYDLDGKFMRTVTLKSIGTPPYQIEATIQTDWLDAGDLHTTKLFSIFTLWE